MVSVIPLTKIDLRTVWQNEAAHFTPWLAENLSELGAALGMDMELTQTEAPVGAFSLDILAKEANSNRTIVIENQLEQTNHDHLGKILTYAAGMDADVVVWIAREIREEHRQALDWLNERTATKTGFFGVVIELFKIGTSEPAFKFDVVVRPNQWRKSTNVTIEASPSGRQEAYRAFFQSLVDTLREGHRFTNSRVAQPQSWYMFTTGVRNVRYDASFNQGGRVHVGLYLDLDTAAETKELFDRLYAQKEAIESAFGESLTWERLDNRAASRIALYRSGSIVASEEELEALRQWMVEKLLKFRSSVTPFVQGAAGG